MKFQKKLKIIHYFQQFNYTSFDLKILQDIKYNQDTSCLAVSTSTGYKVYNLTNGQFKLLYQNTSISGGIQQVCMLYRSSLLAIVGTGTSPLFPQNSVVLFDDQSGRTLSNVSVEGNIKDIQMTRQKLAIQADKITLYNLSDMQKTLSLEYLPNSQFQLVGEKRTKIFYQKETGYMSIYDIEQQTENSIKCHETMVKAFASNDKFLFTMSEKGTLLRGFNLQTQEKIMEWRRGYTDCNVYSIATTQSDTPYVAISSDHKTIHIVKFDTVLKSEQIKLDYGNWKLSWMSKNQLYCINKDGYVLLLEVKEDDKKLIISIKDQQSI